MVMLFTVQVYIPGAKSVAYGLFFVLFVLIPEFPTCECL